jgi:hypothetical protein
MPTIRGLQRGIKRKRIEHLLHRLNKDVKQKLYELLKAIEDQNGNSKKKITRLAKSHAAHLTRYTIAYVGYLFLLSCLL